jgi:hypothetical protein
VLPHSTFRPVFSTDKTREVLDGLGVAPPPEFESYAPVLYDYWAQHLDPLRARRRPGRRRAGRGARRRHRCVVGIGREAALQIARKGGIPLLVARRTEELEKVRAEIEADGGTAGVYSVDLTSEESVDAGGQADAGRPRRDRHAGEQRRPLHPPLDRAVLRPLPRLRADDGAELLRAGPARAAPAAAHDRAAASATSSTSRRSACRPTRPGSRPTSRPRPRSTPSAGWPPPRWSGRGVTFTNIHMPLVRTPMIAPTGMYDKFPTLSPEQAGAMIVEALEDKPKHVGTRLGTVAVVATALAPEGGRRGAAHRLPAVPRLDRGGRRLRQPHRRTEALSAGAVVVSRLLPGVHW